MEAALTPYDEVPYPSGMFWQTHPRKMALPAALYGLSFAPAETARVLEIGCGEGGNLIPMALTYPEAQFVGFDLAPTAIAAARRGAEELGLTNIAFKTLDILEADAGLGTFDYVIAHGVYSWVPEPVREGLLRLARACLSPQGLVFVSYNALPGCHVRIMVRQMLLHHLRDVRGFEARANGAREFLEFFITQAPDDELIPLAAKDVCASMLARGATSLFHDELGEVYEPFHLHEFVADAARHGLSLLGEAQGRVWREELFPSTRGKAAAAFTDDVNERNQYLNFLMTRLFHQSILCGSERAVDRTVDFRRIRQLWVTGALKPTGEDPDLDGRTPAEFQLGTKTAVSIDIPPLKRALAMIGQAWPGHIRVADLPDDPDVDEGLLQLFTGGYVDLITGPAPYALEPGERPAANRLARLQLARGRKTVCSYNHGLVDLEDDPALELLPLLDGSRTRADLAAALATDGRDAVITADMIEQQLNVLCRLGLLAR